MRKHLSIEGPPGPDAAPRPVWRKLAWFGALATASMLTVAAMAYLLRSLLFIG